MRKIPMLLLVFGIPLMLGFTIFETPRMSELLKRKGRCYASYDIDGNKELQGVFVRSDEDFARVDCNTWIHGFTIEAPLRASNPTCDCETK